MGLAQPQSTEPATLVYRLGWTSTGPPPYSNLAGSAGWCMVRVCLSTVACSMFGGCCQWVHSSARTEVLSLEAHIYGGVQLLADQPPTLSPTTRSPPKCEPTNTQDSHPCVLSAHYQLQAIHHHRGCNRTHSGLLCTCKQATNAIVPARYQSGLHPTST